MESKNHRSLSRRRMHLDFPGPFPKLGGHLHPKSFSPEQVQESIRLSMAENLWRYMHTETHREPVLTHSRSVFFPQAASSTAMSSLTQRANQKLEEKQGPDEGSFNKTASVRMFRMSAGRFPSDSDFKRVMEKLNRVYAQGGVDSLKVALTEGKSHEFLLDADDWMYARVGLYGQLCPVVINIVRSRGRLVAYTSKSIQEPMEMLCDSKFTTDRIWVSDPGVRFRTNTLFISFHALEEATFTVTVTYGQKKRAVKEKWKSMSDGMFGGKDDEWTKLFASFTERKPKVLKDFISINRVSLGRDSPDRGSYFVERSSVTDLRRREVLERWHVNLESKKQRALEVLNRQELKELARLQQVEIAREKSAVAATHRKWLAMIWATKLCDHFLDRFVQRKEEIEVEKLKTAALRKIQRAYRHYTQNRNRVQLSLRRCSFSLSLAVRNLGQIESVSTRDTLVKCIRSSASNARIPIKFTSLYQKIVFLQTYWRDTMQRDKKGFEQLQAAWNVALAGAINAASKKKPAVVKGKKTKENPSARYLNITSLIKNKVLTAHFRSAKEQLIVDIRAYIQSRKHGVGNVGRPEFRAVPSSEEMMKLVEKAAEVTLQAADGS